LLLLSFCVLLNFFLKIWFQEVLIVGFFIHQTMDEPLCMLLQGQILQLGILILLGYQSGSNANNVGLIFQTEVGGAAGASVKYDAVKIRHDGNVFLYNRLGFANSAYNSNIRGYQSGPYANNLGFVFQTELGGAAGASVPYDAVFITHAGNVGIGTSLSSNPNSYKLAVKGTIGAQEVIVEKTSSTWSDYVFENTYNLRPLSQVESYIKENKHLPEIPSAKEVEANGINLGEMDALLLKKIEELTLYTIEINKKMEEMKKENDELKEKVKNLEN
jgi:hypothetical protein